jgi:Glycosyl hydrolases family 16
LHLVRGFELIQFQELIGSTTTSAQSNYFGKGNTTTYDRGQFHQVTTPQTDFHTYAVNWGKDTTTWSIDGQVVRTLNFADAVGGTNYPQTPMNIRIGNWVAGDPKNSAGTIQWAGGLTDFSQGPFNMVVKSVKVVNANPGMSYKYSDQSGTWQSIQVLTVEATAQSAASNGSTVGLGASSNSTKPATVTVNVGGSSATGLASNSSSNGNAGSSGKGGPASTVTIGLSGQATAGSNSTNGNGNAGSGSSTVTIGLSGQATGRSSSTNANGNAGSGGSTVTIGLSGQATGRSSSTNANGNAGSGGSTVTIGLAGQSTGVSNSSGGGLAGAGAAANGTKATVTINTGGAGAAAATGSGLLTAAGTGTSFSLTSSSGSSASAAAVSQVTANPAAIATAVPQIALAGVVGLGLALL